MEMLDISRVSRPTSTLIDTHKEGDCRLYGPISRIIKVSIRIEVLPNVCGYNYMKKIPFDRQISKEYVIAERDFKYLYPSDFEDLYLLNLQGHLNHFSPEDKKILTTADQDLPRDNPLVSVESLGRNRVTAYAVRVTWLIADIEDKYHGASDMLHNPP
ncbi:hypothetical protein Tco_1084731 [Tanacetum coccineum]